MSNEVGYNGWANYETWLVALWMDNEQTSYTKARNLVKYYRNKELFELADALKDWVKDWVREDGRKAGLATDLMSAALGDVDWLEIAKSLREEK